MLADFEVLVENALANAGPDVPSMEGWWSSKAGDGWQVVVQDDASCEAPRAMPRRAPGGSLRLSSFYVEQSSLPRRASLKID